MSEPSINKYETINTFTRMPSPAQMCSYLVITVQTVIFYLMVRPNIDSSAAAIALTTIFTTFLAISLVSSFICSYIDPSDSVMIECKKGNRKQLKTSLNQLLYCDYCQAYVTNQARHCKQCDRCVQKFDHHCMWINNCVGSKNYRIFILMITSTCLHLSVYIISVIILSVQKKWTNFLGLIITAWAILAIVGVLWFLLLNLNILHFYLICKGYTTYQFILIRRDEQRKQQFKKLEQQDKKKQQKLKQAVEKAKRKLAQMNEMTTIQNFKNNNRKPSQDNKQQQETQSKVILQTTNDAYKQKNDSTLIKQSKKQITSKKGSDLKILGDQQNSQVQSVNMNKKQDSSKKMYGFNVDNQVVEPNQEDNKQQTETIKISQFFIRNKSYGIILSNQTAQKPKKALHSSLVDKQKKQKQIPQLPKSASNKKKDTSKQLITKITSKGSVNSKK